MSTDKLVPPSHVQQLSATPTLVWTGRKKTPTVTMVPPIAGTWAHHPTVVGAASTSVAGKVTSASSHPTSLVFGSITTTSPQPPALSLPLSGGLTTNALSQPTSLRLPLSGGLGTVASFHPTSLGVSASSEIAITTSSHLVAQPTLLGEPVSSHQNSSGPGPGVPRRGKAPPVDSFTAEDPSLRWEDWLRTLERAAMWNDWSAEESLMQLAGHLRGRALVE